jgi:hypothetical protein
MNRFQGNGNYQNRGRNVNYLDELKLQVYS